MDVSSIDRTDPSSVAATGQSDTTQSDSARNAYTAARKLNSLNITDREYSVVRDPQSQLFKVVVLDKQTGTVLDQFPPEDILQLLAQLSSSTPSGAGSGATGEAKA